MNQFEQSKDYVDTKFGKLLVVVHGDRSKPAMLTCHDIGLNSKFYPIILQPLRGCVVGGTSRRTDRRTPSEYT